VELLEKFSGDSDGGLLSCAEALAAGLLIHDASGRIIYANRAACQLIGLKLEQLRGAEWRSLALDAIREDGSPFPCWAHPPATVPQSGRPDRNVAVGLYLPSPFGLRWLSVSSEPLPAADSSLQGIITTIIEASRRDQSDGLRQSELRFRDLVETTTDCVWEMGGNLLYSYVSPRVRDMLGYEPEDMLGKTPLHFMSAEEADRVSGLLAETIALRRPFELFLNTRRHRSGREVVIEMSGVPFFDAEGRFRGYRGIDRDATERKQAEDEVRRERDFSSVIVGTVDSLVVVLDREGRIIRFNHACERCTGYSFQEVVGRKFWDLLLAPEDVEPIRASFERSSEFNLSPGDPRFVSRRVNPWVTRSGERRLIEWSNTVLTDRTGAVEYRVATGIDITEHRATEEALRASESFIRLIMDSVPHGVCYLDAALNHRYVNKPYEREVGRPQEQLIGRPIREIHGEGMYEKMRPHLEAALEGRQVAFEITHETESGENRLLSVVYVPHFSQYGTVLGIIAVIGDITEQRQLEERLRHSQKMEAVGTLAGGVAHDFNNLLTIISGYSELLQSQLGPRNPLFPEVEEIKKAGERASSLTRRLLTFSRRQVVQPRLLDLNAVVNDVEIMLRRLIGANITMATFADPDLGAVKADPGQIEQIIVNLAVNARDAMPEGGSLTIRTRNVEVDQAYARRHPDLRPGMHAMLSISDTGTGMDERTQAHLFEPFFTTKDPGKGTGLGLPTVYGIVKQCGGHIRFASEPGRGTTFEVYLPLASASAVAERARATASAPCRGSETVLLVEDEPAVRAMMREALTRQGYKVLEASGGFEALLLSEGLAATVHLLLTDVVMPGMGGRQLAEELRARSPNLRVLYVSGYTEDSAGKEFQHERSSFLAKPFTPDVLLSRVRQVLEDRDTSLPRNL
jgi:PAS domain S-box-containing protein